MEITGHFGWLLGRFATLANDHGKERALNALIDDKIKFNQSLFQEGYFRIQHSVGH